VELGSYSNLEMARMAWAENNKRQDLTAIEEAIAIIEMMDSFDWTQRQAGRHLGLSQSAISNKIRLLRLPEQLKDKVLAGELSERQGLAILPAIDLDLEAVSRGSQWLQNEYRRLVENPEQMGAEQLRRETKRIRNHLTGDLSAAEFPTSWELATEEHPELQATSCKECERRTRDGRCEWVPCMEARTEAWQLAQIQKISEATGLPYLDPSKNEYGYTSDFWTTSDESQQALEIAMEKDCENLYVAVCNRQRQGDVLHPDTEDGEQARYVCKHGRGGSCTCRKEARHGEDYERQQEEHKQRLKDLRAHQSAARDLVQAALDTDQLWAWRLLARHLSPYHTRGKQAEWTKEDCLELAGHTLTKGVVYWDEKDPASSWKQFEALVDDLRGVKRQNAEEESGEHNEESAAVGAEDHSQTGRVGV
jgi:hypothetical protein